MLFFKKQLLFIIILTSISNICLSHEFWIDPIKYHITNNEIVEANIFIGEDFEGSPIPFTKNYFKISFLYSDQNKLKIKGRLGDIPALKIKKLFSGLNIIQIESSQAYRRKPLTHKRYMEIKLNLAHPFELLLKFKITKYQ